MKRLWWTLGVGAVSMVAFFGMCCALPVLFPEDPEVVARREEERSMRQAERAEKEAARAERQAKLQEFIDSRPEQQDSFCEILTSHRDRYLAAGNDLQRSAVRRERGEALRGLLGRGGRFDGWVGKIKVLTTTGQGNAVLRLELLPCEGFTFGTASGELADVGLGTLVPAGSELFSFLSETSEGNYLKMSGRFVPDPRGLDGWADTSLTERGSMTGAGFLVVFRH